LSNQAVKVDEAGQRDTKVLLADVIDSFIVDLDSGMNITVQKLMRRRTMNEQSECSRVVCVVRMEL